MTAVLPRVIAGAVALAATAAGLIAAQRLGVFRKVEWALGTLQEITFVYVEHVGAYKTVGKAFEKLVNALKEKGISVCMDSDLFVGVYKDDPGKVPAEECRALACVVLDSEAAQASGLPSMTYQTQETLMTSFPYYNFWSILLSVSKVYPALKANRDAASCDEYGECLEVYDKKAKTITFHVIKRQ